ncbi:MAG: SIR2 family protein, partial [Anaerolineales bacterium]
AMHENAPTANGETPVLRETSRNLISKTGYDQSTLGENIEALLSRCEAYLEVNADQEVRDFVNECKSITLEQCTNFLRDKKSGEWRDEKLYSHGTFLHRLSRRRVRDPRLKIFTTNYDLCFERAAALRNLIAIDGFSFAQPRRFDTSYFEYDVVRRPLLSPEVGDPLEGVFHLLKLHGSVNWERDENGGIRETLCPSPERACLIYPATGKYQQSYVQPHLELMAQYLAALRQPNTCLMVAGFGFNDDHLAEPILAAAGSNPQLRVIVVDYQAEDYVATRVPKTSRYWRRLADLARRGENVWFINAAFSDFANLLPDLKALTPAQQLEKSIKRMGRYS